MTLPTTTILPLRSEKVKAGGDDLEAYVRELVFSLQQQYEDVAQAVNGDIRRDVDQDRVRWSPVVNDTNNPNTTFTYDRQTGWVLRQGILVDVWFDVSWTAAAGATSGKMYIEAPYLVAKSNNLPFAGVAQTSGLTYTAGTYCTLNARSGSRQIEVWNSGNGIATFRQDSSASGRVIGHVRYVAQGLERD